MEELRLSGSQVAEGVTSDMGVAVPGVNDGLPRWRSDDELCRHLWAKLVRACCCCICSGYRDLESLFEEGLSKGGRS
jgi:hypothetical protein